MKLFMLKAILIASIMFVSVLFGMQLANDGILRMKGYHNDQYNGAFIVEENHSGELEATILGNDVTSHDIKKKKEELEEMKAYNFFSSLGKQFAGVVSNATEKVIQGVTDLLTK